ncbi:MAG: hypothetical protein ACRDRR_01755 [Pseudonocardiaceae bacterium]
MSRDPAAPTPAPHPHADRRARGNRHRTCPPVRPGRRAHSNGQAACSGLEKLMFDDFLAQRARDTGETDLAELLDRP